jgi:flagellar hook assembly protein FlgD
VSGKLIKNIHEKISSDGYRINTIQWDGRDSFGDKIGRGVYLYKLTVKNNSGQSNTKIQKLVVL